MFTIKKILSLLLAMVMSLSLFTACSGGNEDQQGDAQQGETSTVIKQKEYNYLTGMPFADGADKTARPVAVMINNLKIAHPQSGLTNADIIYEAVTEGGITRLMAVYSDIEKIEKVGPVRSARDAFIEMLLPLNAIYVHIGTSTSAERMLNFYSYKDIDGIYLGSLAFEQNPELAKTKGAEHSWFTNKELIKAGINKNGIATKNNFYPAFDFVEYGETKTLKGENANTVSYAYSNYADVSFSYDASAGKYLKNAFGVPHMDADTNTQLAFDNVFVILADVGIQEENGVLADIDLTEGTGYYFYGGKYEEITWKKGQPEEPLLLYDADGEILKVNTGKSYIGILDAKQADSMAISEEVHTVASVERVQ
ncbi:MAG: DUF3048 domain-containing protein [Oscillospiraceae bacterium]|nr:DUF3048 domain-containing protein [Oscillospiraceae bacterium]